MSEVWTDLVAEAAARLANAGVADPENSARWIAREATGSDATEWLEVADRPATKRRLAAFDKMVERRLAGEPLQYVVGSWGFRTLDLFVDNRVLIPRPETEVVADAALAEVRRVGNEHPDAPVADLGTGSGAIGLSLAAEAAGTEVWLTDISADALRVAKANLAGLGRHGGSVRLAEGDWFQALPGELAGRLAVVVSNPPYVAQEADLEPQVARWEPISALVAPERGMAHLILLIDSAPAWLLPSGALVLEMSPEQVEPMAERAAGVFHEVETVLDLTQRPRAVVARRPRSA